MQVIRGLLAIFFVFIMLDQFSIDPKPLLAGIGVVGLGLSLAAQNILRDFLNGLFIIIEDQFNVGDWVSIDNFSGTVESFTMRATRLRTSDGRLITIPNGNIAEVVNSTKDFAVAIVEIGLPYDSDLKKVIETLEDCAADVAASMPGVVVEESKVQSIVEFRENAMVFRVLTKTMPGEQWGVERATRVAIIERFQAEGIEIPSKQVVVYHTSGTQNEDSSGPAWLEL
jgi:small conductance mechanosensitive channel